MKKYHLAVTIQENEKYYSYVLTVPGCINLIAALRIKNIYNAMICNTKKSAVAIVEEWNNTYKHNKCY